MLKLRSNFVPNEKGGATRRAHSCAARFSGCPYALHVVTHKKYGINYGGYH